MDTLEGTPLGPEQTFITQVLTTWGHIMELSNVHRKVGIVDGDNFREYASSLCSLWGNLRPEVEELKNADEFIKAFMSYEEYYFDTQRLIDDTLEDPKDIFRFEMILKSAIKKLGYTNRSEVKK